MKGRITTAVSFAMAVAIGAASHAATDVEQLRALHDKVMRAHREGNVDLLLEDEAPDYVVASRGEVTRPSIEERRSRLGPYLSSATFEEYSDLIEPIVSVSVDATLGWVIVQMRARGARGEQKEPIAFVCAWIEMYEKRQGRWVRVGNVSNFKP